MEQVLINTKAGLYCPQGDFYIDPSKAVDKALITHAHSDHSRKGHKSYLASRESEALLRTRLGANISLQTLDYGESININGVNVSFHPAGHILGSSQIRIEFKGQVFVASGDYKIEKDSTCTEFEVIPCHTFITESTFALPVFRWCRQSEIFDEINTWWSQNREDGITSVVLGYSLGKAQRILSGLNPDIGPIAVLDTIDDLNKCYTSAGISLPKTYNIKDHEFRKSRGKMIVAPPHYMGSYIMRKFGNVSYAFASGWMQIRRSGNSRGFGKGFVLSDHADWNDINKIVDATGAESIWISHGYTNVLAKWLQSKGKSVRIISNHNLREKDESDDLPLPLSRDISDEELC